jgi:hypothetical protein
MINRACRESGVGFVVVPVPRFHHWNARECPKNWERRQYGLDEPYQYEFFRYFREAANEDEMRTFDLLELFKATSEFPLVFEEDPHWNNRGHEFVAHAMEGFIIRHYKTVFTD